MRPSDENHGRQSSTALFHIEIVRLTETNVMRIREERDTAPVGPIS